MPPKIKPKTKRKLKAPIIFPIIPNNQLLNDPSPLIPIQVQPSLPIQVQPSLVEDLLSQQTINPLLINAEKAYTEKIAFEEQSLRIEKTWVSINPLPEERFGPISASKIDFIKTPLQDVIDGFLRKVYDSPIMGKDFFWITGPSGTGKTFNLLINVLKSRRAEKNIILLHMTLDEKYLSQFSKFFFNDLAYAFFPVLKDQSFPACPEISKKTESPLKDWLIYMLLEIKKNPEDFSCFSKFLNVAKEYFENSQKKLVVIVDQTNIIQRQKNQILAVLANFLTSLLNAAYSHKVVNSSSYNNEDLDPNLQASHLQNYILRTSTEGCFSREQTQKIVELKCSFNCDEDQLEDLIEITGSNPLEIWEFCKRKESNFEKTLEKYTLERTKTIFKEISHFYNKKVKIPEWKEQFLTKFFIFLDAKKSIQDDYEDFIDRKYMFVQDDKLYSISPIAQQIMFQHYSEILLIYEENHDDTLTTKYRILYSQTDKQNDPSLKGFLFEKMIINQLLRKKNKDISIQYYNAQVKKDNLIMKFSSVIYFKGDLSTNLTFDENIIIVPYKFNNPFADFYYYNKTKKILFVFQITISIFTHKNSDVQFFKSKQHNNLRNNKGIQDIIFVWITDMDNVNEISLQFKKITNASRVTKKSTSPKDERSLIVLARENQDVWRFD